MPIYEFGCEACGQITERLQKVDDPPPEACPACGSPKLSKLVSRTSFQLKGGGWYSDLYASSSAAKPGEAKAGKAEGGDKKPESGGEKKAESKPADPKPAAPAPSSSGDKK